MVWPVPQFVRRVLRRAAACRRGNVAVMFALTMPMVVGGAGLGVETTYWYLTRTQMQQAADAAAYAGAMEMRSGSDLTQVTAVATATAGKNAFNTQTGTVQVNNPPSTGNGGNQAVEVILNLSVPRYFSAAFNSSPVQLTARAVAKYTNAGDACVLALNTSASRAVYVSGSATVSLTGCSVMANSVANDAIYSGGSSSLAAKCLISGGGVSLNATVNLTCASAVTNAAPIGDPYRNLAIPTDTSACRNDNSNNLQPGRYCSGMTLKNNQSLAPGVYIISGGDLKVNAGANITGTGVTLYLAAGSNFSINGNATVNLTAPTSGTYAGMLMFGDRTGTGVDKINGTASSHLTGAIYFKKHEVDYLGNFSGQNGCVQVVADTVQWSGNADVSTDCSAKGMTSIPALALVKLTE